MTDAKPRELWLLETLSEFGDRNKLNYFVFDSYGEASAYKAQLYPKVATVIHVIEYSAYEKACAAPAREGKNEANRTTRED